MLIELLMKKNGKLLFGVFMVVFLATTIFGVTFIINNLNTTVQTFKKDGYALQISSEKNAKAMAHSFTKGTDYRYKETNNSISFNSEKKNVKVDENTIIHYSDKSLGVLKKVVGIDASQVNGNIIFYYNIYKNTEINASNNGYTIKLTNGEDVTFKNLLMRINDKKFLLTGDNVRLVFTNDEIVDFGDYVEFEYTSGNVVKVYNNEKYYQTISSDAVLLVSDIKINLKEAIVYKNNKQYISLTNLVVDNNGNIDALEAEVEKLEISDGEVDTEIEAGGGSATGGSGSGELEDTGAGDQGGDVVKPEEDDEKVEDEKEYQATPEYKVTELKLTALKVEAKIEITDEDALISSDTTVKIIENATSKVVYEETAPQGDATILVSTADLNPDTEYTILANADYLKGEIEYNKNFISKIFRTDALGVTFKKSYATSNAIAVEIEKENYSEVSDLVLTIYDGDGKNVKSVEVDFDRYDIQEIEFPDLKSDSTYMIRMSEIVCQGVVVDNGFAQKENYKTLKVKPEIGELSYEVDKRKQSFNLGISSIVDQNYGIKKYRYEIYDARSEIAISEPLLTLTEKNLEQVSAKVDDVVLHRGVAYTYVLVIEFDDNEKVVEYSKELGTTMTLDGVEFPTVRWDSKTEYVTWEQINGTIIIDDPSSAIVSDKFQINYKNSIGVHTARTINADTSTGNIPININGLRANETYTFDVHAEINLQDGNDTEDMVYIGSVFVQTKSPNHLVAQFNTTNDYSNAFSINFKLENDDEGDSSLEASTLSEITFTLYKGATTDGAREVYRRILDTKTSLGEEYTSSIKMDFYDKNAIIEPAFFNAKNTDFTEDVYTLEVSKALDYTEYKNEIPIEKNTFSFKLNTYIPEIPDDPNDAVIVQTITNNTAEGIEDLDLKYDERLNGNITVGYKISPRYNNETKTARYIEWQVHKYNAETETYEYVEGLDKRTDFPEDGNVPETFIEIKDGTSIDVNDIDALRRGNSYYFSYKIYLDIDDDGEVDTVYPEKIDPNITLRSKALYPLKQEAEVIMYPTRSTTSTYTWKYKIKDVDRALEENKLYSQMDGSTANTSSPTIIVNDDNYNEVTFTGLTTNAIVILKKKERTLKFQESDYTNLTAEFFQNNTNDLDLSYSVTVDTNKLVISIDNYNDNVEKVDKIAAADVTITPYNDADLATHGVQTIKGIEMDNENIIVDFIEIYTYLSIDIKVDVSVYYDSGRMGYEIGSDYVALQKVSLDGSGQYYSYNKGTKSLEQNSVIKNSVFKQTFKPDEGVLELKPLEGNTNTLPITIDKTGVTYNGSNIIPKELKQQKLTSSNNIVRFDLIIPGISMLDSSNKTNITALLDNAELRARIVTLDTVEILDDKIYIDLYETDQNGTNARYLRTIEKTVTDFDNKIVIPDLVPEHNYYIQFFSNVLNKQTGQYERRALYDVDQMVAGCKYTFYTLARVEISNINAKMVESSYTNKKLQISYNLDTITGYDRIEYKLQKYNEETQTYMDTTIEIPNETAFFTSMKVNITATPGKNLDILYGGKYQITLTPIGYYKTEEGETEINLGTVVFQFTIAKPEQPHLGIQSGKTANTIYFKVSISDKDYIIKDSKYTATLKDSKGNEIVKYTNQSILEINKSFTFTQAAFNLQEHEEYTFIVSVSLDNTNDGQNFTYKSSSRKIRFGDSLNIGNISTTKNFDNPEYIDIVFSDSYKLSTITTIQYSVNNTTTGFFQANQEEFTTRYDSTTGIYYYTIEIEDTSEFIPNQTYIITMNFMTNEEVVGTAEVTYFYAQ